ncbi:hypothetical protein [Sphingomonas qomolangmaensis]|uniref:Uncharacterized protein n=1 Tax=Sphingomonas qomolangmaensis TaxID=2918765 RepID=A0ABY5LA38_9SPHN|nr:hypothetical protein [Sphingomonas qomolangmaensis]UUL83830.1 hypothetical protein NMP03_06445 [Sphingomonas qomolangmaensis]
MGAKNPEADVPIASPHVLAVRELGRAAAAKPIAEFDLGELQVEVRTTHDSVFVVVVREGRGGVALRAAHLSCAFECKALAPQAGEDARLSVTSALGRHLITLEAGANALENLRVTVRFTPAMPMLIPFLPRDLYPIDNKGDPLGTVGSVEAKQRKLNVGIVYFRVDEPRFGDVLYFQNLTSMNDYYGATGTTPESIVGGSWPELGHLIPIAQGGQTPPAGVLEGGTEIILSDAILVFRHHAPPDERETARRFLQMLGVAYQRLDLPCVDYRDWVDRAERTLRDLDQAPEATIEHYGHRYIHPYTNAEYPDIMVQMSVVAAIHDWGKWCGTPHPLEAQFKAGLEKFYDPELQSLRRYLPNVGDDKDADAVDSWYLYHPMLNLGLLALDGDEQARTLLLKSIDFGIKAAHHFNYEWPVQYKVTDFSIITELAGADCRGQTDVAGIYAWVMLQAFELTDEKRFLDEARCAIDAAMGLRFGVNYQANLTAWGAAACMRLWRITNRPVYLEQSYVYLASFFQNCVIWESKVGHAAQYKTFLGVTCLQDAPYMAIYECFDSFAAFECYLADSGPDLEPAARLLVAEYCRYALDRGWYFYPDALPPEAVATEQRESNGHIDPKLSFPLEDLYPDGRLAGQVGQEVYGAGAAFIFATRSFHPIEGAPFRIYCDQFVQSMERTGDRALTITLAGGESSTAGLSIVRLERRKLGAVELTAPDGDVLRSSASTADRIAYEVPASGRLVLTWE